MPAFRSETEEATWWFEHREENDERLLDAIENSSAVHVADLLLEHGLKLEDLREIAVPIKDEDVDAARAQAASLGMEYHEYMGKLLHEALRTKAA